MTVPAFPEMTAPIQKKEPPLPFSKISHMESKLSAHMKSKCNELLRQLNEIKVELVKVKPTPCTSIGTILKICVVFAGLTIIVSSEKYSV